MAKAKRTRGTRRASNKSDRSESTVRSTRSASGKSSTRKKKRVATQAPTQPEQESTAASNDRTDVRDPPVNEVKWGKEIYTSGWTCVPNVLLEHQSALGIGNTELVVLLNLLRYWYRADEAPHPAKDTVAAAMGVAPRTVQRAISRLGHDGLLETQKGYGSRATNRYFFEGLRRELKPHASRVHKEREEREKKKRKNRGRRVSRAEVREADDD